MNSEQRLEALRDAVNDLAFDCILILPQVAMPREVLDVDPFANLVLIRRVIEKLAAEAQ